jgi:phage tail protein X
MAIIQISKIQQRSGNLVDLPQLDQAQLGWANDAKRLFIGTTAPNPNENVEVLTAYSTITFSQISGGEGNLNLSNSQTGQLLTYVSSTDTWENYTGNSVQLDGQKLQLGNVANISMTGGAIGYVLETDGLGNLSWTSKSTITAYISAVSKANPGVVTTTQPNFFTLGALITITDVVGMTQLNGNSYYAKILTSNTFSLYSDSGLTTPVDTSGYTTYSSGGRVISTVGGSGSSAAAGSNTTVQFNDNNVLQGNAGFTFNKLTGIFTAPSLAGDGGRLSNIAGANITGSIPLATYATTANSVAGANVSGTVSNATYASTVATVLDNSSPGDMDAMIYDGNIKYTSRVTIEASTGTLKANLFSGNGSALTSLAGANVSGAVSYATTANSVAGANVSGTVSTAGTVTNAAQPNITSVGTLTSLNVSGQIINANITTGASSTPGNLTGTWTLSSGSTLQATYADLAEYYESDRIYEPGTVLAFGGDKEVTVAEDATTKVAGIVSTNPAYVMNTACEGEHIVALALQGRVPCKVRGNIKKGDMLVSAGNGFARPSPFPILGTVIGKSLENFNGIEGTIQVAVGRL